jgi:amino acid adenylation domain-containing protein
VSAEATLPASSFQERIWLAERLESEAALYNVPFAWRVSPRLDPALLGAALAMVVERHEILRTAFVEVDGRLRQRVGEPWAPEVAWEDLAGAPEERLARRLREEMGRPFDVASGRLLRTALFELGRGEQLLFLCCHHLVWDEGSTRLLLEDLDRCYRAAAGTGDAAGPGATPHQERMAFVERFEKGVVYPTAPIYHNLPLFVRLAEAPGRAALAAALAAVAARHEAVRTRLVFTASGFAPRVAAGLGEEPVWLPAAAPGDGPPQALVGWTREPLDLAEGPAFRLAAQPVAGGGCWLGLVGHQAVVDRASLLVVAGELRAGVPSGPAPGFGGWWRGRDAALAGRDAAALAERVGGDVEPLRLPVRRARPAVHVYDERTHAFDLDGDHDEATLLAAFAALLALYSGQDELVVGTVDDRRAAAPAELVGPVANLLPIRLRLAPGASHRDLRAAAAAELAFARAHGAAPFDDVVRLADPDKDMSRMALFDVLFQRVEAGDPDLVELGLGHGKYDLHLFVTGTRARLVSNGVLFDEARVRALAAHYARLLELALADPDAPLDGLDPLSVAERRAQVEEWNATTAAYPETTIHGLVAQHAAARPDAVALVHGERRVTYGALLASAERAARGLVAAGVRPGELVGLLLPRGVAQVEAILATLLAGAAYLPVDVASPPDRLTHVLGDAGVRRLIGVRRPDGFAGELLALETLAGDAPLPRAAPDQPAYCIYTSGTTGGPKGVLVSHRGVVRLVRNDRFPFDFGPADAWTMLHSYAFDFSVWEVFGCLANGGRLVIADREEARDPDAVWRLVRREGVTVLNQTPGAFAELLHAEGADPEPDALRCVVFGGEKLQPRMLAGWLERRPGVRLVNMYGITETTVHSTVRTVTAEDAEGVSNIGRPIPTTTVYLLDPRSGRRLVPAGGVGEIHVGGEGVALGYLGRPALTAERFRPNPFGPGRLYRSGDLARSLPDGTLEVIGRADAQVKLRGYRIEPGEIESCLREHPAVEAAVVVLEAEAGGRLVAHVRLTPGAGPTAAELRAHVAERLPAYMVPAVYRAVPRIPLTENGKVDRAAVRRLGAPLPEAGGRPLTATARAMAELWSELLDVPPPEADASFFDLGGHSLLATRVLAAAGRRFGVELPLRALFERPRLQDLADLVDAGSGRAPAPAAAPAPAGADLAPASGFQERIWFAERLEPGAATYNVPGAWRVRGRLDPEALGAALARVVERHEILHTAFLERDGALGLAVVPPWRPELERDDLRALTPAEARSRLESWMERAAAHRFDPASGHLLRAALVDVAGGEQALLLCLHHLVWDAASEGPFLRDLAAWYAPAGVPPPAPPQFRDLVAARASEDRSDGLARWVERLDGAPPYPALPAGREPEPNGAIALPLRPGVLDRLAGLRAERGVSWFMVAGAALAALLHRMTGQADVTFGVPVAGREGGDDEDVVGPCLNTVVVRSRVRRETTLGDLLDDVRERVLEALEDRDVPFEAVVERLRPPRRGGWTPYVDVTLNADVLAGEPVALGGAELEPLVLESPWRHETKFGVTVTLLERGGRLDGVLSYRGDRLPAASAERMARELADLFERFTGDLEAPVEMAALAPPGGQYRDFVAARAPARVAAGLAYWTDRLAGAPAYPTLAPPRVPEPHGSAPIPLPAGLGERLRRLGTEAGASRFTILAAALAAVLHRWTGEDDVTFGVPVAERGGALTEVIGPCMNTVVIRSRCEPATTLGDLLGAIRERVLAATEHQDAAFEAVVDRLNPPRRPGWTPYIDVSLAMQEEPPGRPRVGASELAPFPLDERGADHLAKFGLLVGFTAAGDSLEGGVAHRGDRVSGEDAAQLARLLGRVLERFPESLDRPVAALDLLDGAERERVARFERGPAPAPPAAVPALVARQVAERPDAVAIETDGGGLSYRELDARACALAARLVPLRRGERPVVAIALDRGADAVVAMLACWLAGCAFSTLDPTWPLARLDLLLDDLDPCAALAAGEDVRAHLAVRGIPGPSLETADLAPPPRPDDLAYVLFTSGTTGRPKGVMVRHASLAQLVGWMIEAQDTRPGDRVSQVAALTFDPALSEIWPALGAGATLVPYERRSVVATELAEWLDERRITLAFAPTLLAEALWATGAELPSLRWLFFAGSALSRWPAAGLRGRVVNAYGPTETTVYATALALDEGARAPLNSIGRPIRGATVHVLDPEGGRCPAGVPGEVHLGGTGVASGYWRRPELTAERFLDGEDGPRYRTGDRGRWLPSGDLEFLGRLDRQLKVRGYRVEPAEVEAHLLADPLVERALVAGLRDPESLVAYAVARPGAAPDTMAVLGRLAARLPRYLVPDALLWLDELPATGAGKLDVARLPRPARGDLAGGSRPTAPRSDLERRIAGVWRGVLRLDAVGVHDNFFDLGGSSLLLATLHARLRQELGCDLPIRRLFEHPTVGALAAALSGAEAAAGDVVDARAARAREALAARRRLVGRD